jgi:hypothetical protein
VDNVQPMAERVKAHAASIDAKVAFEKVNNMREKRGLQGQITGCVWTLHVESQSLSHVIFRSEV